MDEAGCERCGAELPRDAAQRLTWGRHLEDGSAGWTCPTCSREHCRSIEARLDQRWW